MNDLTYREFNFTANIGPGDIPFFGVVSPEDEGISEDEWGLMDKGQRIERLRLAVMEQITRETEISWD